MTKTFVGISDPVHDLIRNVTRRTPLRACLSPGGQLQMAYQVAASLLPDAYYGLAWFHALKGMPASASLQGRPGPAATADMVRVLERVGYFDVLKLDRRCARDMRIRTSGRGNSMLSGELLVFGTGALRACNDNSEDPLHRLLWSLYGRIAPKEEVIYANIRCLAGKSPADPLESWKETFDSSNLIYGDALGELQQLWDRRADTAFLDQVARSLQHLHSEIAVSAFLSPPRNFRMALKLHLGAQARWRKPPETGRALLRRVEWILDNTIVDHAPRTTYRWREPNPHPGAGPHGSNLPGNSSSPGGWRGDGVGYDSGFREEDPS